MLSRATSYVVASILLIASLIAIGVYALGVNHRDRRIVTFTVQTGERLSTLWGRLETEGIASQSALRRITETVPYRQYSFVPPPGSDLNRFEGLFVPGRYRLALSVDPGLSHDQRFFREDSQIVDSLLARFAERLTHDRDRGSGLPTYGQIILASIVEKEDVPRHEYRLVASVFLNRLAAGMRLSSCPTLEYSLGYHRPFLLAKDLAVDSPYNTYLHGGLPPTPICFFSDQALESVVRPIASPYFFFVLDWVTNRISFSTDFSEHQRYSQVAYDDYARVFGEANLHRKEVGVFYEN